MKLRPPAVPLITVDPYFSVWSLADRLTDTETCHWTEKPNTLIGIAEIDGTPYRFIGADRSIPAMEQVSLDVTALETVYRFRAGGIILTASFMTSLFPDDYEHLTRPVSYLELCAESEDAQPHHVQASISASEEFCLDCRGQMETETTHFALGTDISCAAWPPCAAAIGSKTIPKEERTDENRIALRQAAGQPHPLAKRHR